MEALDRRGGDAALLLSVQRIAGGCHIFSEVTHDSLQLRSDYK